MNADTVRAAGKKNKTLGFFDAYCLGVALVIPGLVYGWNLLLADGMNITLINFFLIATGYMCNMCCVAEMTSFFPFGGGSYGVCRCIIHPYIGYLVGVSELLEYVLFTSFLLFAYEPYLSMAFHVAHSMIPYWWALFFVVSVSFILAGSKTMFGVVKGVTVVAIAIVLFYFFVGLPSANMPRWTDFKPAEGHFGHILIRDFSLASWLFAGIEGTTFASDQAINPHRDVPLALVCAQLTLIVLAFMVVITSATHTPGTLLIADAPGILHQVFENALRIKESLATLFYFPVMYCGPFTFIYASSKLLNAMCHSSVLPPWMGHSYRNNYVSQVSVILVSSGSFAFLFAMFYMSPYQRTLAFNVTMMCACFVYICLSYAYLISVDRYSVLKRHFVSPSGKLGAYYGAGVFTTMFLSYAFFQVDYSTIVTFLIYIAVVSVYYWLFAAKRERFSEDEVETFIQGYIINANIKRKQTIKKNKMLRYTRMVRVLPGNLHGPGMVKPPAHKQLVVEEDSVSLRNSASPTTLNSRNCVRGMSSEIIITEMTPAVTPTSSSVQRKVIGGFSDRPARRFSGERRVSYDAVTTLAQFDEEEEKSLHTSDKQSDERSMAANDNDMMMTDL